MVTNIFCSDESAMEAFAAKLAKSQLAGCCLYLQGDLGAGKTTIVRAALKALGVTGSVHSPTYTLVEPYEELVVPHYHFDLYRLQSPWELEELGLDSYFTDNSCCWIEWPDRGEGILPSADLILQINNKGDGREIIVQANSTKGQVIEADIA